MTQSEPGGSTPNPDGTDPSIPPDPGDGTDPGHARAPLSRRAALGTMSIGVVGGALAGGAAALWLGRGDALADSGQRSPASATTSDVGSSRPAPTASQSLSSAQSSTAGSQPNTPTTAASTGGAPTPITRDRWMASRGDFYFIAHRGSGDVYPENSIQAFRAAIGAGARCMEISVGMTSDGRLICMHDLTYDRTTTATGNVADQPSTILRSVSLKAPQLGPAWAEVPLPRVPFLEEVLSAAGGKSVLCLEAKVDAAYPSMIALAESLGLRDSVIVKAYYTSSRIDQAKAAGYPVFGYLGNPGDVTHDNIAGLAHRLDSATDCLVVPAYDSTQPSGYLADGAIRECVATGIPVWVFPVHRRADAAHFRALGVQGVVTSSYAYVSGSSPIATADTWRYQAIAPGEMTRDPSSPSWAPTWTAPDSLTLGLQGRQQFVTMGQFGPAAKSAGRYRIDVQAAFTSMPTDGSTTVTIAFCCDDDRYYENGIGRGSGYHATIAADGRLELFRHVDGSVDAIRLGSTVETTRPVAGQWMQFRIDVSPEQVSWSRTDGGNQQTITSADTHVRGGYCHIGRSGTDGAASFRTLMIS